METCITARNRTRGLPLHIALRLLNEICDILNIARKRNDIKLWCIYNNLRLDILDAMHTSKAQPHQKGIQK